MDTVDTSRTQTAFRLRADLLVRLKIAAKKENRSLNNFVESILMESVYREPNAKTKAAIDEARSGKSTEGIDVDKFEEYIDNLQ